MINDYFQGKSPFCHNYCSSLLEQVANNKRNFPQALIFEGNDTKLQYFFSLELAIELNKITGNNSFDEKWIKTYSHPAINLISQIHGKPDDDTTKTVISVKQARNIETSLKLTSDYYRFFIFFSSQEYNYSDNELIEYSNIGYQDNIDFSIEPLKYDTFNIAAVNTLLKSVEEPPKNTSFIFLTNSKENILPTITSRCQVFKLNSNLNNDNYSEVSDIIQLYQNINIQNAYQIADKIFDFAKDRQLSVIEILEKINLFLKDAIIQNQSNYNKCMSDIKIINQVQKMIKANVSEKLAVETMVFRIARGY